MSAPQNILRGIFLMLCAVFLFASMDATAKWLTAKYPVPMLVWARYLVHCLLMLVFLFPSHGRRLWYSPRPGLQIARALMLLGVTGFTMLGFRLLSLTVATTIAFGSCSPAAVASCSQRRNIATGSGSRSRSASPPAVYSRLSSARIRSLTSRT